MVQLFVNTDVKWEFTGVTGSTPTEVIGLGTQPFNLFDEVYINLSPGVTFSALGGTHSIYGVSGNSVFINITNTSGGPVSGSIVLMQDRFIELDLIEAEPIRFTKRSSVLENPEVVASNYTNTFIVPHTSKNGNFFKAAFNVNSYSFDASKKVPAYLNIDGSRFTTGDLRLNSVIRNDKLNKIEYEVIFIGEVGSFAGAIGSKLMNQLDLSLDHQINYNNIVNSWSNLLFNGNIIYPLIDWGYTYDNSGIPEQNTVSKWDGINSLRGFTKSGNPLLPGQFKPAIKVKYLFRKILNEAGFTYQSNFIDNSDIIDKMYHISTGPSTSGPILPLGNLLARYTPVSEPTEIALLQRVKDAWEFIMPNKNISTVYDPYYIIKTENRDIYLPPTPSNPAQNLRFYGTYNTTYFKIPNDGQYRVVVDNLVLYVAKSLSTAQEIQDINIYIYKNGVPIDSITGEFNTNGLSSPGFYNVYQKPYNSSSPVISFEFPSPTTYYTFQKDDEIELRVQRDEFAYTPIEYKILYLSQYCSVSLYTPSPEFSLNSMFPENYKQIDFIKSLSDKFKLIWEPDPQNPNNFFIEPWINWIKSGKKRDWSDKLNENFNIIVKPAFQTQPRTGIWKDQPETDIYNYQFQQEFKKGFGEVKLYSNIEIISGENTIQTNIAPIQVAPIGNSKNFLVPHLCKDSGEKVEPIEVTPRFCFYNGLIDNPIDTDTNLKFRWHLINDALTSVPQDKYPLVSNYYTLPGVTQSLFNNNAFDISWDNVKQYWEPTLNVEYNNGVTWQTAFNNYWREWYNNTYDPYSRIIEAEFALDNNDIRNLRFNDRIWVKDAWYFPLTIKDYVMNDKQNVRVELLRLGNIGLSEMINLTEYEFCYNPSNACSSCCCYNTIKVWAEDDDLQSGTQLYLNNTGAIPAPSGWYSKISTSQTYYYNNGLQTGQALCASCTCTPVLFPADVCEGLDLTSVCCCTIPSMTVYCNGLSPETSTQICGDPGGTTPLTPFTWVKEIGGNAVQVGADGHTVIQFNNCSGIIC